MDYIGSFNQCITNIIDFKIKIGQLIISRIFIILHQIFGTLFNSGRLPMRVAWISRVQRRLLSLIKQTLVEVFHPRQHGARLEIR